MERVTGIGGIFFKANDPEQLTAWYQTHLGFMPESANVVTFQWRADDQPMQAGSTVWSPFPSDTTYFGPNTKPFMINYRVANLDRMRRGQPGIDRKRALCRGQRVVDVRLAVPET